jgi:hypothetical protein
MLNPLGLSIGSCIIVQRGLSFQEMARDNLSREFFRKQGKKGGKLSAKARIAKLTPEQRSEVARKAAAARWKGHKKGK